MKTVEKVQHTPGPWEWREYPHGVALMAAHSGQLVVMDFIRLGMQGAEPRFSDRNGERRGGLMNTASSMGDGFYEHPDALLIAAAPDLLRALKATMGELAHWIGHANGTAMHPQREKGDDALRIARATLANLEG